jgi:hypothetical protein
MATDNNIKNFTAADIERYHKGLLSSKEMNEMERAALDDPFLADAMEGYAVPGVNAAADIADLQKRLAAKSDSGKVVAMYSEKKKPFMWWRVAAAVLVIGGAAVLANQFLTKGSKQGEMAVVTKDKTPEAKAANAGDAAVTTKNSSEQAAPVSAETGKDEFKKEIANTPGAVVAPKPSSAAGAVTDEVNDKGADREMASRDDKAKTIRTETAAVPTPTVAETDNSKWYKVNTEIKQGETAKKDEPKFRNAPAAGTGVVNTNMEGDMARNKNFTPAPARKMEEAGVKTKYQQPNIFRGRITDANNTGLPFAKVYNPADNNAGTYTDANGYFALTHPDSSLTVQIKALGFENANTQLFTYKPTNRVVMQDDRSLSEVVISRQMPNSNSRSANNMQMNRKLEEPEPADGWSSYDAYLANNLEAPDEIKTTERSTAGSVQVSFEVDKNGEPVNITVEKSLCPKCDKEAIRLVKDGPKWKRTANKHGRTTVTINF